MIDIILHFIIQEKDSYNLDKYSKEYAHPHFPLQS